MSKVFGIIAFLVLSACSIPPAPKPEQSMLKMWSPEWTGSGFVMRAKHRNVIITNAHVCQDLKFMVAEGVKGDKHKVRVLGIDEQQDLCALQAPKNYPAMSMGYGVKIGQPVCGLGFPFPNDLTKACGKILGYARPLGSNDLLTTAASFPGDSGGPLFDMQGRIIGCVHAGNSREAEPGAMLISLAIQGYEIREFLKRF